MINFLLSAYRKNVYIKQSKKFYALFINPGVKVFDIGANIGKKTKIFLSLGAQVIAVEPQPNCVKILKEIFDKKLLIVNKGMASENKKQTMYISNMDEVSTFSEEFINAYKYQDFLNWNEKIEVEMITINTLIEQFGLPAFCKIDVENYEFEILKVLEHKIPVISFEFNRPLINTTLKCLEKLDSLGPYTFNLISSEKMQFYSDKWLTCEQMVETLITTGPNFNRRSVCER